MKQQIKNLVLEKVPIIYVFKQGDTYNLTEYSDTNHLELYGFLEIYMEELKKKLVESFSTNGNN